MAKKYMIVCVCVLAICAVFGLNARTDYTQMKNAIEFVDHSADIIMDDVTILDCFAYVFEDYRIGQKTEIKYLGYVEGGFAGTGYAIRIDKDQGTHTTPSGTVHGGGGGRFFTFQTETSAVRILNALEPLTWQLNNESPNTFWGNILNGITSAINAVVLVLGVIFTLIQTLFVFVTDSIAVAWSVVAMGLYILGFPVAIYQ